MRYGDKIVALLLALTMSSTSSAQGKRSDTEDKDNDKRQTALVVSAVILATVAVTAGGYKFFKHLNNKAVRETTERVAREEAHRVKQRATAVERSKLQQQEVRQAEYQVEQRATAEKVAREAQAHKIERGEALAQMARTGKKMTADELRSIYDGRVAALEVEKAKKMQAIHEQYPDNLHSPQELEEAVRKRNEEIAQIESSNKRLAEKQQAIYKQYRGSSHSPQESEEVLRKRNEEIYRIKERYSEAEESIDRIHREFNEKFPEHRAVQKLEDEHQHRLERLRITYNFAKNSTDGFPEVKYAPEFANKISAIIAPTSLDKELSALVKLGNLQEVVWKLEEGGFASEATAMTKLIEDVLTSGEIINKQVIEGIASTQPLLVEFDSGLKGVFKGDYGQYNEWKYGDWDWDQVDWPQKEIATHKFDQLLGLRVFPITVPRQLAEGRGSMQLFVEHSSSAMSNFYKQHISYAELIGITPDKPDMAGKAKNWTFFNLTMDSDTDAIASNNIYPFLGRMIKIDADQAFNLLGNYESIGDKLLKNPENFYTDPDFIERLDNITTQQLEEIFQPLFDPSRATDIVKSLHENIRSYVDAAREIQH